MASASAGLYRGGIHSRLAQAVLTAFAIPYAALFIQETLRNHTPDDITAGVIAMILPACLHLSAAWLLLRRNSGMPEFDRRFTNWLVGVGLFAGAAALVILGVALAGIFHNGLNETSLIFVVSSPVVAMMVIAQAMVMRRYFGPMAPATPGDTFLSARFVTALAWPSRRLLSALRPIRSLSLGGLLVLASLLLTTSVDVGCDHDTYYRGHQILTGHGGWITAENASPFAAAMIDPVARVTYAAALICAVSAIVAVLRAALKRTEVRLPRPVTPVVAIATVFTLSDFGMFLFNAERSTPWFTATLWSAYWVVPLMAYSAFGRSLSPIWHRHWPLVRTCLATIYVPFALIAWALLPAILCFKASGFVAYFLGLHLLWFGALQTRVADPVPEMRPSLSSAAAGSS